MSNIGGEEDRLVAGVDLSGRTRGPAGSRTALAWLNGDSAGRPTLTEAPRLDGFQGKLGDANLINALVDRRPAAVALDAPLELPHPVRCTDSNCPRCFPATGAPASYSTRELELVARWRDLSPTMKPPMPMVMVAGIAFRAIYLRRALRRAGLSVIETWPMGVYRTLQKRAGNDGPVESLDQRARRALLESAITGLDALATDASTDELDSVAAAYAAWAHAGRQAREVKVAGFEDEGTIHLPVP